MAPKLATSDVAKLFGTTEQHVRKLAREGRIPYYRIGALLKFDRDEVNAYLADHRVADVHDTASRLVARSCAEQEIAERLIDPAVLRRIATLIQEGGVSDAA